MGDGGGSAWPPRSNGAKGELAVLNRRRGYVDDLEPNLYANNVDRSTLDAMNEAVVAVAADFRRYLRAKATAARPRRRAAVVGPLRADRRGGRGVVGQCHRRGRSTRSAGTRHNSSGLATRAFAERWVDAEIRDGKRGGAYCASVDGDVSRVMMNFDGSHDSVSTLAHELGHAFHNVALVGPHADPAAHADGPRRDRIDLLRDAPLRELGRTGH